MNLWDILDDKSTEVMNKLLRDYNLKKIKPNERQNRKTHKKAHQKFGKNRNWSSKPWSKELPQNAKKNV